MAARVGLLGALLVVVPTVASAQGPPGLREPQEPPPAGQETQVRSCRQVLPSDVRRLVNARGQEMIYFRDPVRVLCTGGLVLESDSAVMNRSTSAIQLIGNVFYQDTIRQLTADWANYIGQRSQLLARGNVILRNNEDGSVVQGDELDYLQASETRAVSRMTVRGDRPYAVIPPRPDSTGVVPDSAVSTEVWASRMEFIGQEVFRGIESVEIRRGDMRGAGELVVFDQAEERLTLSDDAFFRTDQYRLEGEEIVAYLVDDQIRTVTAEEMARVVSEELTVESEQIRIGFIEGRLDRMEAWNPDPRNVPRALADAEDFRLRADSIDARADSLGIREVRAVGRAFGERDADSASVGLADAVTRDWIQGDTIIGYFSRRPTVGTDATGTRPEAMRPGHPDSTTAEGAPDRERLDERAREAQAVEAGPGGAGPGQAGPGRAGAEPGDSTETVLERIVVIGGGAPALSLYRMPAEEPGQPPSINFLKALTITLFMKDGDVTRVEADGPLDGVYLSPGAQTAGGPS